MSDKRISPRLRSFLKGRVVFNGGQNSLDCLIRDMSSTGARLELSASVTLPDRFDLYLPHRDETCRAHLQWRRGGHIGVAFDQIDGAPEMPIAAQDVAARVQQLETEIGLMRVLLAQMKAELEGVKDGRKPASDVA
jgi:PilZ domain